jgi:hypothetical protein|tara:strand:- start:219 stop:518 length:300 start_codon:yes stop_codon:yes gene_type:complete
VDYLEMGVIQSLLQTVWKEFFQVFGFMCSSDFVVKSTPVLMVVFLVYRVFGPSDQGVSFGQSGVAELEPLELVSDSSYGGGGANLSAQSTSKAEDKKNR